MAAERITNGRTQSLLPTNGGRLASHGNDKFENTPESVQAELAAAAKSDRITQQALPQEARLIFDRNVLLIFGTISSCNKASELRQHFFGSIFCMATPQTTVDPAQLRGKIVYMCGDISWTSRPSIMALLGNAKEGFIIGPLSTNYEHQDAIPVVDVGRVPLSVHSVGVLYRQFLDIDKIFEKIQQEHKDEFEQLTGHANKGIYLTPVTKDDEGGLKYHLLRSSIHLSGPTDNFRATDHFLVESLNQETPRIFDNPAPLNHVLAQLYQNTSAPQKLETMRKDMPTNGIVAFSTFYGDLEEKLQRNSETDPFDWVHVDNNTASGNRTSGLTRLRFSLKDSVMQRGSPLIGQFHVTLYPNSVFFMPLSTNRLYTHEICPSTLKSEKLPMRLGYVVQCSATAAVHREGQTYILQSHANTKRRWEAMEPATEPGVKRLKTLHDAENKSERFIDYGGQFLFSMNHGDYDKPKYDMQDEFRIFSLEPNANPYRHLIRSVALEEMGPGRKKAVLVHSDPSDPEHNTPLVRTTTKYHTPAQCFKDLHHQLANEVRTVASLSMPLNNALVELYDNRYLEEAVFHTDQAQDLAKGSHIALFSCYQHPDAAARKLVVESKSPDEGQFEIPLTHNSVVVWSLETNGRFRHKIVLEGEPTTDNHWLGFTFRTSSTLIQYRQEEGDSRIRGFFADNGMPLVLLEGDACGSVYKLRKMENAAVGFEYPAFLTSTISPSDLLPPVSTEHHDPEGNHNPPVDMETE